MKGIKQNFYDLTEKLTTLFFPKKCLVCGEFYHSDRRSGYWNDLNGSLKEDILRGPAFLNFDLLMDASFCNKCSEGLSIIKSPFCRKCGTIFKSRKGGDRTCSECVKHPLKYRVARSAAVFDGPLIDAVHEFKYNGKIQIAKPLSILMFSAFLRYTEDFFYSDKNIDLIMPVPLHSKRFRNRGFNQAFLLIRNWNKYLSIFNIEMYYVRTDCRTLLRKINTESQAGLGRDLRKKNIRGAFYLNKSSDIKGKRILLVDDVYTTGATVNECSKVLLKGGALSVDVLTLARTI